MNKTETIYTHKGKKGRYIVQNICEYQHENVWYSGIIYLSLDSGKIYVRQSVDFDEKFSVIFGEKRLKTEF